MDLVSWGGLKIKFCALLIFDIFSIEFEFTFLSCVIKMLSEINIVLIESNNIHQPY